MEWESEALAMVAEEQPVMMESEQKPPSLAVEREAPVFGEEVMVEEPAAEGPYAEVLEETAALAPEGEAPPPALLSEVTAEAEPASPTPELSEEQRAAIAAFKEIDADGDGELTAEEIYRALSKKNADVTLERVQEIMAKADKDKNGTISQAEYLDAVAAMGAGWIGSWLGKIARAAALARIRWTVAAPEAAELTNEELRDWVKRWCRYDREGLPHISTWNTSKVTDMSELFMNQKDFNDDISAWDTSSVRTMKKMFLGASSFNQPLNDWRVYNVTDMSFMFYNAESFNRPLSDWRVDKVTNMSNMFLWAKSFNWPIGAWRVDKVTSMRAMFNGAFAFNQPLNDWRVDKVTDMCGIFMAAKAFNKPLGNWRVDNATNVDNMFEDSAFSHWEDLGDPKLRSQKPSCCAVS